MTICMAVVLAAEDDSKTREKTDCGKTKKQMESALGCTWLATEICRFNL